MQFWFLCFFPLFFGTMGKKHHSTCLDGCSVVDQVLTCSTLSYLNLKELVRCVDRNRVRIVDVRANGLKCTCEFLDLAKRVRNDRGTILFHDTICLTKKIKRCGAVPKTKDAPTGHTSVYTLIGGHVFDVAAHSFKKKLVDMDDVQTSIISKLKNFRLLNKYKLVQEEVIDKAIMISYSVDDQLHEVKSVTDPNPVSVSTTQHVPPKERKDEAFSVIEKELYVFTIAHVALLVIIIVLIIALGLKDSERERLRKKKSNQRKNKSQPHQNMNGTSEDTPQSTLISGSRRMCHMLYNAIQRIREQSEETKPNDIEKGNKSSEIVGDHIEQPQGDHIEQPQIVNYFEQQQIMGDHIEQPSFHFENENSIYKTKTPKGRNVEKGMMLLDAIKELKEKSKGYFPDENNSERKKPRSKRQYQPSSFMKRMLELSKVDMSSEDDAYINCDLISKTNPVAQLTCPVKMMRTSIVTSDGVAEGEGELLDINCQVLF